MVQASSSAEAWFDHLSDGDRELLSRIAPRAGIEPSALPGDADALSRVLANRLTFEALFNVGDTPAVATASPFLTFAVVVHRAWDDLQHASHVDEWVGPRQRLPVLGGDSLRDFLATPARRLFLVELLTSYTSVTSGAVWIQTRRGWRRRRFSELDPVRLASMLEIVPDQDRPGVYRRLGDLCLFLTGVFPDHTEIHALGPIDVARLLRFSGLGAEAIRERIALEPTGTVSLLEHLGQRWYEQAARIVRQRTGQLQVVAEVAEQYSAARRTLNYVTDRYLFEFRGNWFGAPAA